MTPAKALALVEHHGVVLVSAKGPVPRLTEMIAGEPIKGSWWSHPKSHQIFAILEALTASADILVCRLVGGKVTLVHRRLWPALVRVANRFEVKWIAQVSQEHTPAGHHVNREIPFPHWVPTEVREEAKTLDEQEALISLGPWTNAPDVKLKKANKRSSG